MKAEGAQALRTSKLNVLWGEITFSIRYIWRRNGLRTLLLVTAFGNNSGAGMALLYVSCAIAMFTVGAVGYRLPQLHQLEDEGY